MIRGLILAYLPTLLAIIHCIKTGRNTIWIWVLAMFNVVGVLAYVIVEVIPDLGNNAAVRRTARGLKKTFNPEGDLRRLESQARMGSNVASRQRYADELASHGRFDEAIAQYRSVLTGLYEHDPNLMLGVARAQFGKGDAAEARATLDDLIRLNPDFRSPEGHLLYARALEGEGNIEKALEEYQALSTSYPGAEAAVRYAQLLESRGRKEEAQRVARELLDQAKIAPKHYRRAQRSWLDMAARIL